MHRLLSNIRTHTHTQVDNNNLINDNTNLLTMLVWKEKKKATLNTDTYCNSKNELRRKISTTASFMLRPQVKKSYKYGWIHGYLFKGWVEEQICVLMPALGK